MGTIDRRHRLWRSRLSWHRTPVSQVNRSAAAVPPPSRTELAAAAPEQAWPGRETRDEAERWNDHQLQVLLPHLPAVGRALLKCDGANHPCGLLICAVCARAYRPGPIAQLHALAHAITPGPMKSRLSTSAFTARLSRGLRTSGAPTKCSGNVWTARASNARLWWAASRWLGRRTGSAGSCMPTCSPSASTRTPGSGSKPPWKTAELRIR